MFCVFHILLILLFINEPVSSFSTLRIQRTSDICESNNGKKVYLEAGESGELTGSNITTQNVSGCISFGHFKSRYVV